MNSGTVKDVRTIDLTYDDDDDDDDTSGDQNGNMEWMNETIFHFQQFMFNKLSTPCFLYAEFSPRGGDFKVQDGK